MRQQFSPSEKFFIIRQYDRAIAEFRETLEIEDLNLQRRMNGSGYATSKREAKEAVANGQSCFARSGRRGEKSRTHLCRVGLEPTSALWARTAEELTKGRRAARTFRR